MPELPEVEIVRRGLEDVVKGKTIRQVEVFWPNLIVKSNQQTIDEWIQVLKGATILDIQRRGKFLLFVFDKGYLSSHLRMEGKYFYFKNGLPPKQRDKHTHIVFHFSDDSELQYHDVRKFGRFEFFNESPDSYWSKRKLGPEPIIEEFDLKMFAEGLSKTKRQIKPALLSQEFVVGLGNIYVDEVLFESKVHPMIPANRLTMEQIKCIYNNTIKILKRAIDYGGSTIRTYTNTLGENGSYQAKLKVYGKKGQPCPNCSTEIERIVVGQRGTHICPHCQSI